MATDFESRVRDTGLRLHALIKGKSPQLLEHRSWAGEVLARCMDSEPFKVQLLRYLDVFPHLSATEEIARYLEEYMAPLRDDLPSGFHPPDPRVVQSGLTAMSQVLTAGTDSRRALPRLEELRTQGISFSADLLGEAVVSEQEAEFQANRYLAFLELLDEARSGWEPLGGGSGDLDWGRYPKINVSIKPTAFYSQISARAFDYSVDRAKERLKPVFQKAVAVQAHVCLDMEHRDVKNLTLAIYRSLLEDPQIKGYPHTGVVIQAYLRDSENDLRELVDWARRRGQRIGVRLVKGAYREAETVLARQRNWPLPFFTTKRLTDTNFERLARYLLEHRQWVDLACATHNIRALAHVIELSRDLKVPENGVEFQLLHGMAEPLQDALLQLGLPLRTYTPIGEMVPGMAYLVRRLLEILSPASFLRRAFQEGAPPDKLLENPLQSLQEAPDPEEPGDIASSAGGEGDFNNEPHLDWSLPENRERFAQALNSVKKATPYRVPLFVGGRSRKTKNEIRSTNPNDPDHVVGIVSSAEKADARRAVASAVKAFPGWRDRDPQNRARYLFKAADVARKMRHRLAALQVYEVGKNWSEADADVCEAIDFLEYYGRQMLRLSRPRQVNATPGEKGHLGHAPRGVAAVIAPWNFPLAISMGMTSAALVAGNTVVYKPASSSCVTGSMISDIFKQIRLPRGVLNFLPGPGEELGEVLATHPDVAVIGFTGSRDVGLGIIERAAQTPAEAGQIKAVVAEMGGKNAIVVDEHADLDQVVIHVLQSTFGYQGQKCSACSRLIAVAAVHDRLLQRLKAAAQSLNMGSPEHPQSFMGAVIDTEAKRKILEYMEIGKKEGKLLLQRSATHAKGHFVPMAIFRDVTARHRIAQEEIFGPVLAVIKVADFEEGLDVANQSGYALTGSVFSRSPRNIEMAKSRFQVGNLYINRGCTGAVVGRHPFGGFKMSGLGAKAGGPDYLLHFMVPRCITENTFRRGFAPAAE